MIEWVPINDFEFLAHTPYLVAYKDDKGNGVGLIHHRPDGDRNLYSGKKISHASYINFPVEKTLEEKFEDVLGRSKVVGCPDLFVTALAQIAKQHYEGKE